MATTARKLTHNFCRSVSEAGIYADLASPVRLVVRAGKRGIAKTWDCRLTYAGKRVTPTLGRWPDMGLEDARAEASKRKALARDGVNPKTAPKTEQATFADCLQGFWRDNPKTAADPQWVQHCRDHILPVIGDTPVADIALDHVLAVLRPIWLTKNETARRAQSKMRRVIAWACVHRLREPYNPAVWDGNLEAVLPAKNDVATVRHQSAVQIHDAPRFWAALSKRRGVGADALAFLVLTVQQSGNILNADWSQITVNEAGGGRWDIPAGLMKAGKPHSVPLQAAAVDILKRQPGYGSAAGLVFTAKGERISEHAMRLEMRRVSLADAAGFWDGDRHATPHGWRSTFRSWAANRGIEREAAEKQLAHDLGSAVEMAYQRADMIERRAAIMNEWHAFLENGR